jgi:hypothetical protein
MRNCSVSHRRGDPIWLIYQLSDLASNIRLGARETEWSMFSLRKRCREVVFMRYYHVIKRSATWEVYANDATTSLASDPLQAGAVRKARRLARNNPGKIVLHTACDDPIE